MNPFSKLQNSITVDNIEYKIPTDFRSGIKLATIFCNEDKEELINFLKENNLPIKKETIEELSTFLSGKISTPTTNKGGNSFFLEFDFNEDESYIYSSFLSEYNIDLYAIDLHWLQFWRLLTTLNQNCIFMKILHYRTVDISKVPKEQKEFYREMKRKYSLKNKKQQGQSSVRTVEERNKQWLEQVDTAYKRATKGG